jgi:branched-chain amino acid transport system permease protein
MINILLMVVIGGMGTLYGAVLGATLFIVTENYLQDLMKLASHGLAGVPLLRDLVNPDRWLLWLGLLFILSVYRFPFGIVGKLRLKARRAI